MHPSFYTTLQLPITPPTACRGVRNGQTPLRNYLATRVRRQVYAYKLITGQRSTLKVILIKVPVTVCFRFFSAQVAAVRVRVTTILPFIRVSG